VGDLIAVLELIASDKHRANECRGEESTSLEPSFGNVDTVAGYLDDGRRHRAPRFVPMLEASAPLSLTVRTSRGIF
jgi:hypothetical protein